ncbi:MAG: IclR family transcriptional regulator [Actinobacteria bacterium]|nr:IclR family transcriptional regulator [Actinomycetota bacterium]
MEAPKYPIESVDNALRLILQLKDQDTIGVTDASELLEVAPSTAHRLLQMLQYRGFAVQDPETRVYRAGPQLLEVGLKAVREMGLRTSARPVLERLSERLNETVHLLVREGTEVRFVDGVESSRALRVTSRTGVAMPAHCTAGGKALLAELAPEELRELYPGRRLPTVTNASISRRSELEKGLEGVRERGYATNFGETETEVSAIAAAIRDRKGRPLGAIAVAVPSSRLDTAEVDDIGAEVITAAKEVGSEIE